MKKVISVLMSTVLLLSVFSFASVGASAEINAKKSYTSTKPAKQKWTAAYDSFYSGYPQIKDMKLTYYSVEEANEFKIRQELVFPIYELAFPYSSDVFLDVAASMETPAKFEKMMTQEDSFGAVLEYVNTGDYYGEAGISVDRENNVASINYGRKYKVGDYFGRRSMTITEGLENQLAAKNFSPKTTTARALYINGYASGVYFKDKGVAAFYCSRKSVSRLEPGRLYTLSEMSKDMTLVRPNPPTGKPVIYLYPTAPTDVSVKLGYPKQNLTYTYPAYNGGWHVTAYPDGKIVNRADRSEHWYLFWEGDKKISWRFDEGFVVKGSDTESFLREKLAILGLTTREMNDFITYWSPEMTRNEYNMVTFSKDQYEKLAPLAISPAPDTMLRVHMVFKPCEKDAKINPQRLAFTERRGFTVVEWGGTRA